MDCRMSDHVTKVAEYMSYQKFDRRIMTNLGTALPLELLHANSRGAYHCSSVVGCNTRKYHGLLVVPSESGSDPDVLLSSMDETVIQHGAEFHLAVHKYHDGTLSPNGHKYIREFSVEECPRTIYRVGGVVLSKEIVFSSKINQLLIRYRLLEAHSETTLRLMPMLAFRTVRELTHINDKIDWSYTSEDHGVSLCLYKGMSRLYMQLSKYGAVWHQEPTWYRDFFYDREAERGNACVEDLPVPGYFSLNIRRGEDIILSASDCAIDPETLEETFEEALRSYGVADTFATCLRRSARQFFYEPRLGKSYLKAGYPWYGVRLRDEMVGLTACSFGIGEPELYHKVMDTALPAIWSYLDEGEEDSVIEDIWQPDSLLWVANAIQDYYRWAGKEETKKRYGATLRRAIRYIREGRVPLLEMRRNGLLYADPGEDRRPITWMGTMIDGAAVVDRRGYIVEYNALWYNALCFYRFLFDLQEDEEVTELIDQVRESFIRTFVNEHGYLLDYVADGRPLDWSVRPSQIIAVGLTYSPMSRKLQRSVLDYVTKELLTPKGLRSLSPVSPLYKGYAGGNQRERYYAYVQGGAWPWTLYYYLSAYLKLFKRTGLFFVDRMLIPFEEELSLNGIGTISEIYDGTPPYRGRSDLSFMMSVSAILRIVNRMVEYKSIWDEEGDLYDSFLSMTSHHSSSPDQGRGGADEEAAVTEESERGDKALNTERKE